MSHLGEIGSLLGPQSTKPKSGNTFQAKARRAFDEVGQRLAEQEIASRDVREKTERMIDAVGELCGGLRLEMNALSARLESVEAELERLRRRGETGGEM